MKNIKLIGLLLFTALVSSCSSDDDSSSSFELSSENIAGTYNLVFTQEDGSDTQDLINGQTVETTYDITGSAFDDAQFVFTSNGSVSTSGDYLQTSVLRTSGSSSDTTTDIINLNETGTYVINAQDRTVTFFNVLLDREEEVRGTVEADITRFTEDEIRLVYDVLISQSDYEYTSQVELRLERM